MNDQELVADLDAEIRQLKAELESERTARREAEERRLGSERYSGSSWALWVCVDCPASADWSGSRDRCGRCGSREREQIRVAPWERTQAAEARAGLLIAAVEEHERAVRVVADGDPGFVDEDLWSRVKEIKNGD